MRLKIGSGFGIPVYLHWTFLLVPLWVLYKQPSGAEDQLALAFTALPLLFVCVVLHEFGHALAARHFGIGTHDITLYPIGGVARLKRMSDKPLEEIVISVAGPAVNVAIAVLLSCILLLVMLTQQSWLLHTFAGTIGLWLLLGNTVMVLFNLLPIFPMDGGRVFRAVLASWLSHYQATQIAVAVGMALALVMGVVLVDQDGHPNYMLAVIAVFVFFAGQQELAAARYRHQQRYLHDQEEPPLEVLPVRPVRPLEQAVQPLAAPVLLLQPKILVYTWDNQTGLWRKDPSPPS
jgi:Zn-dependent protease